MMLRERWNDGDVVNLYRDKQLIIAHKRKCLQGLFYLTKDVIEVNRHPSIVSKYYFLVEITIHTWQHVKWDNLNISISQNMALIFEKEFQIKEGIFNKRRRRIKDNCIIQKYRSHQKPFTRENDEAYGFWMPSCFTNIWIILNLWIYLSNYIIINDWYQIEQKGSCGRISK